jgi:hypothetical protein
MIKIIGVMVLHHEGNQAREALTSLLRVCKTVYVLHDGPSDIETRKLAEDLNVIFIEMDKRGCKEAQLTEFLGTQFADQDRNDLWYLNTDSDEILSENLICEIQSLSLDSPMCYWVPMRHICADGVALRYANHSVRVMKIILFHVDAIKMVIGLPHKGVQGTSMSVNLTGDLLHKASHLNYSFLQIFKKEMIFAIKDAKLRSNLVRIFLRRRLISVSGGNMWLPLTDRLRFLFPLLAAFPAGIYSLLLSLRGLLDVRSFRTFNCEVKLVATRPFYQIYLCYLIYKYKNKIL